MSRTCCSHAQSAAVAKSLCASRWVSVADGCSRSSSLKVCCSRCWALVPPSSSRSGEVPPRRGNYRDGHAPSGVFRCAGDDAWLALEVVDDQQWAALAGLIGAPWAGDPALASAATRVERRDELSRLVSGWTESQDRDEAAANCRSLGVPAAAVLNEAEMLFSEPFASSGFWQSVDRDVVGTYLYPAVPLSCQGERPTADRPAPLLGQHNEEVFTAMGLDSAALAELRAMDVIGETPGRQGR